MLRVGVTGQNGFVGQHLFNTLGLYPEEFTCIPFDRSYFQDDTALASFAEECDVVVHLAAMNRHNDPQVLHDTNILLVEKLIAALEATHSTAHVLFSSSSQEERDNLYGKSKKAGRELLVNWAKRSGGRFTGLVIPNVFGPFGHPNYNSFIATFCHRLTHGETPVIDADGSVKLIYVGDLVQEIIGEIRKGSGKDLLHVPHTDEYKVSEVLALLETYTEKYLKGGIIPELNSRFETNLFNTFRCY